MSGLIFPFKASPYVIEELIDWEMEGDIGDDPFYRLIFPTMGMLAAHHREKLEAAAAKKEVERLQAELSAKSSAVETSAQAVCELQAEVERLRATGQEAAQHTSAAEAEMQQLQLELASAAARSAQEASELRAEVEHLRAEGQEPF